MESHCCILLGDTYLNKEGVVVKCEMCSMSSLLKRSGILGNVMSSRVKSAIRYKMEVANLSITCIDRKAYGLTGCFASLWLSSIVWAFLIKRYRCSELMLNINRTGK